MLTWIYDHFLYPEHPRIELLHRGSNFLVRSIREVLIILGVRFLWKDRIKGQDVWLEFGIAYSIHRRIYPDYQENLARIAQACAEKYEDAVMIDIGANLGDTILQVRNHTKIPILAIEPDSFLLGLLAKNTSTYSGLAVVQAFLRGRDTSGVPTPVVPNTNVPTLALAEVFQANPLFAKSKLLKTDTDGSDFAILRDNEAWLQETKPLLYFEYDPLWLPRSERACLTILSYLFRLGYTQALVYASTGTFLISLALDAERTWKELDCFLFRQGPIYYYDVCLFTDDDLDLFEKIRATELSRAM